MDHFEYIFVSTLARDVDPDVVAGIARQARINNGRNGITGLLVFDGEDFAQFMEGPEAEIKRVTEIMMSDWRHERMETVYTGTTSKPRRFPSWRLGYLVLDLQEFGPHSLRGMKGPAAMDSFNFMLPALDIALGEAPPARLARRRP